MIMLAARLARLRRKSNRRFSTTRAALLLLMAWSIGQPFGQTDGNGLFACQTANEAANKNADKKSDNWHQWRGPDATGVSRTANPPLNWNDQTNINWKIPIAGEGSSTPIVWGDVVIILSAIETNDEPKVPAVVSPEAIPQPPNRIVEFVVWCIERDNGDVRWKKVVTDAAPHEGRHESTTYAAASPTTDGKFIYASFGSYGIFCLSFEGDLVWQRDLGDMRTRRGWGEAVSPVLHENFVVVNWDQEDQSEIFVLDATTGKTIWNKERDEPTTWATPLVTEFGGTTQLITNGTNRLRSYDLANGNLIWETKGTTLNAIPCPVRVGDNVICMAGYQGNMAACISLASKGEVDFNSTGPAQAVKWKYAKDTPYVPSPLVIDGKLYFTKSNNAMLNCLDAETGQPIFELSRLPGLRSLYASPVAAADRIYLTSRSGDTLVLRNSSKLEVLATNRLNAEIDATPALAGEQIFLRSRQHLYCIQDASQSK